MSLETLDYLVRHAPRHGIRIIREREKWIDTEESLSMKLSSNSKVNITVTDNSASIKPTGLGKDTEIIVFSKPEDTKGKVWNKTSDIELKVGQRAVILKQIGRTHERQVVLNMRPNEPSGI